METRDPSTGIGSAVHIAPGEGRAVRLAGLRLLTRKVSGEQTGGAYSLFEVEVAPRGGEGAHVQHREDECFWVLEGRFGFVVEGEAIEAGPGTLIYVPKGHLHRYRNVGETRGRMLVSQTPGGAYEGFVEEVGKPVTEEPPSNTKRRAAIGAHYGIEMLPPSPG